MKYILLLFLSSTLNAQCVWIKSNGVKKCVGLLPSNLVPWSSMPVAPPGTVREGRDTLIVPVPTVLNATVNFSLTQPNPYNVKVYLDGALLAMGMYALVADVDNPTIMIVVLLADSGQTLEAIYNF